MKKTLKLSRETIRTLSGAQLMAVNAGVGGNDERTSIIYWCPDNTSIQRSCSSCTGSGTA